MTAPNVHSRREFLTGLIGGAALAVDPSYAAATSEEELVDVSQIPIAPYNTGLADFGRVWGDPQFSNVVAAFVSPPLDEEYIERALEVQFGSINEIKSFFSDLGHESFLHWFNKRVSGKTYWKDVKVNVTDNTIRNFHSFWDEYFNQSESINLLEFSTYMCVFVNEVRGDLTGKSEAINGLKSAHPGIAYLYNSFKIKTPDRIIPKASYNKSPNKTCLELFNDTDFVNQYSKLSLASNLRGTSDEVWSSNRYPKERFPVVADSTVTGIILECDFFKYRGRGIIQLTWRSNYQLLVEYVQKYDGKSSSLLDVSKRWSKQSADKILDLTSNAEWDKLFSSPTILCASVILHAQNTGYMPLAKEPSALNGNSRGSVLNVGKRIGGGGDYDHLLRARLQKVLESIFD